MKAFKPKTFLEVVDNKLCQFIEGDLKEDPVFCSEKKIKGKPYCEKHVKRCFSGKKPKIEKL